MKVWLVYLKYYEEVWFVGVFSSEAKALKAEKKLLESAYPIDAVHINKKEFEMDEKLSVAKWWSDI